MMECCRSTFDWFQIALSFVVELAIDAENKIPNSSPTFLARQ